MAQRLLVLHPDDNVAVALSPLAEGEELAITGSRLAQAVVVRTAIPSGHKIALCSLRRGETAVKYGQPIGTVTQDIGAGEHVHIHNLASARAG